MSKQQNDGITYFLNEAEGKYGTYYTNKERKIKKNGEPDITVYPTRNEKVLQVVFSDRPEKLLANISKSGKVFVCSDYTPQDMVFISKGESEHGPYMRVSIVARDESQGSSAPRAAAAPAPAPRAPANRSFGAKSGGSSTYRK